MEKGCISFAKFATLNFGFPDRGLLKLKRAEVLLLAYIPKTEATVVGGLDWWHGELTPRLL